MIPALIAPFVALVVAAPRDPRRLPGRPPLAPGASTRGFRLGQLASGSLVALAHGTNDAQKTMGVITLALVADGHLPPSADVPTWVTSRRRRAIALGTYSAAGGSSGRSAADHQARPAQGFAAQTRRGGDPRGLVPRLPALDDAGDLGRGDGRGRRKRLSAVRWGVAGTSSPPGC